MLGIEGIGPERPPVIGVTIEDPELATGLQKAADAKGEAPARLVLRILREWLNEHTAKLEQRERLRLERLRGLVGCRALRPIMAEGCDPGGVLRSRRWERGELLFLKPELARKHALAEHVEILPPPEEGPQDD